MSDFIGGHLRTIGFTKNWGPEMEHVRVVVHCLFAFGLCYVQRRPLQNTNKRTGSEYFILIFYSHEIHPYEYAGGALLCTNGKIRLLSLC